MEVIKRFEIFLNKHSFVVNLNDGCCLYRSSVAEAMDRFIKKEGPQFLVYTYSNKGARSEASDLRNLLKPNPFSELIFGLISIGRQYERYNMAYISTDPESTTIGVQSDRDQVEIVIAGSLTILGKKMLEHIMDLIEVINNNFIETLKESNHDKN